MVKRFVGTYQFNSQIRMTNDQRPMTKAWSLVIRTWSFLLPHLVFGGIVWRRGRRLRSLCLLLLTHAFLELLTG